MTQKDPKVITNTSPAVKEPRPANQQPRPPKPTKRDTQTFRTPNGPNRTERQQ